MWFKHSSTTLLNLDYWFYRTKRNKANTDLN